MKVLVTGACGNVGALTVALLAERGHEVRALDLDSKVSRKVARGWTGGRVEMLWGDMRVDADLERAVAGVHQVLHLAAIIPPATDLNEPLAHEVNVGGMRKLIAACQAEAESPAVVFCSTAAVFGKNREAEGPRRADEPLHPEDAYGRQKVECERLLQASGLRHSIFRLAVTPPISLAAVSPFIFEFHPDTRVEFTHPSDVARALANTLDNDEVQGRILLIGGGAPNRMLYLDFLNDALAVMGIRPLPRSAFGEHLFYTDWLDSDESERLLAYRRHGFSTYLDELRDLIGPARHLIPPVERLVRAYILSRSRHHAASK